MFRASMLRSINVLRAYTAYAKAVPGGTRPDSQKLAHSYAENVGEHWSHDVWRSGFILRKRCARDSSPQLRTKQLQKEFKEANAGGYQGDEGPRRVVQDAGSTATDNFATWRREV